MADALSLVELINFLFIIADLEKDGTEGADPGKMVIRFQQGVADLYQIVLQHKLYPCVDTANLKLILP